MPDKHVKPTKEELEANIQAAQDALDNPAPEEPEPSEPAPSEPAPTDPAPAEPEPSEPAPEEPDWKKKASESAREAQLLGYKNKELNRAVEEAAQIPEPTTEELEKEYAEWEDMTPTEQRLAKDNLVNKRKFELIHNATAKFKQVDDWNDKIDTFITDPKTLIANPDLEGKIEEFKQFASKPTRRGLEFEDLVLAFFGDRAKNKPEPKKGKMFEKGTGGPTEPDKSRDDKLSVLEGRALMKTDYKRWKELLIAGKIKNE